MTGDNPQAAMLREQGATQLNLPSMHRSAGGGNEFLSAVREAAEGEYDVLGEMGRGDRGLVFYLARDLSTQRLVALKLEPGDSPEEFSLEVVTRLESTFQAEVSSCPRCNVPAQEGWRRYCPQCGADLSVFSSGMQSAVELLEAVREAASDEFEILGEADQTEGGGRVYFARNRSSGGIVALRLKKASHSTDGEEYSLSQTRMLKL